MAGDRNYFIFNKEMDYRRGASRGLSYENGVLKPQNDKGGWFFSRVLDSQEKKNEWHRLRMQVKDGEEHNWKLQIYCSDSKTLFLGKDSMEVEEVIYAEHLTLEQKLEWMRPAGVKFIHGQKDVLLHDVVGRYLWICIQTVQRLGVWDGIQEIRFDFPKRSWISYLPEVYQQKEKSRSFLERYLGIFQSIYEDLTEQIEHVPWWVDPDSTKPEFLNWIAEWIALDDVAIWNEDQLRYLLNHAMRLYRMRGTPEYLKEMVRLYTGCEAYLVEYHQISRVQNRLKEVAHLKKLYGDDAYTFSLLVNMGEENRKKGYHALTQIVEHAVPAHMECRIILLQPYMFLDQYSYLGVNSRLNQYRTMQLDGMSAMHFAKLPDEAGKCIGKT